MFWHKKQEESKAPTPQQLFREALREVLEADNRLDYAEPEFTESAAMEATVARYRAMAIWRTERNQLVGPLWPTRQRRMPSGN